MAIRRIIKEEIDNVRGVSLYLIMDESETLVYGETGGFQPIKDADVFYLISKDAYKTYESANEFIEWINYYKGNRSTPGKIATSLAEHNPKIVIFDLILDKRDENILNWD
jgi:hypothetical protein